MIREIQIPPQLQDTFIAMNQWREPETANRITKVSKLNVFIGPNNSGKSRVLRALYSDVSLAVSGDSQKKLREAQHELLAIIRRHHTALADSAKRCLEIISHAHPFLQTLPKGDLNLCRQQIPDTGELNQCLGELSRCMQKISPDEAPRISQLQNSLRKLTKSDTKPEVFNEQKLLRIYVPTLRGLRRPRSDNDFYAVRTKEDYFAENASVVSAENKGIAGATLLTGLELYNEIQAHLLGTPEQRSLIADFEKFIGSNFFQGEKITLMPRLNADVLHFRLGDEPELPISQIGDGIQHILIMTLPLFLHRQSPLLLFIEEPELFLHPGFQRALINAFLDESRADHQVFVATHSHQFLDITIDSALCSVYRCRKVIPQSNDSKDIKFEVQLASSGDCLLLKDLGVRNSSVFLSNCTIWVEGVTDRMYYRHYLALYQNSLPPEKTRYLEDLHFSFVEYGGANITHWSFLNDEDGIDVDRLCGRAMVICDYDDERKEARHEKLRARLEDRFLLLPCREVENLLAPAVIAAVIQSYEGAAVLIEAFEQDDYKCHPLGRFIESLLDRSQIQSKRRSKGSPYASDGGTIRGKGDFCSRAIQCIDNIDDMSSAARAIAASLYEFIVECNK